MEHSPNPETNKLVDQLFNEAVATLQALPEQEDDGRMQVHGSAQNPLLRDGQTTIVLHSPDDAYKLSMVVQEPGVGGLQRELDIDVAARGENGFENIANVVYVPQQDPLGNPVVGVEVAAPPITVLSEADRKFLTDIGMMRPVEQADMLMQNGNGDYLMAQYLAEPEDLSRLSNLPALVTNHVG